LLRNSVSRCLIPDLAPELKYRQPSTKTTPLHESPAQRVGISAAIRYVTVLATPEHITSMSRSEGTANLRPSRGLCCQKMCDSTFRFRLDHRGTDEGLASLVLCFRTLDKFVFLIRTLLELLTSRLILIASQGSSLVWTFACGVHHIAVAAVQGKYPDEHRC
jgi:hypothetical protein